MRIELDEVKSQTLTKSSVRPYRNEPGNINLAAQAAFHYAKKNGAPMVCVPGNSYMNAVYHIAREDDDLVKFTGMDKPTRVLVVYPNGDAIIGTARK